MDAGQYRGQQGRSAATSRPLLLVLSALLLWPSLRADGQSFQFSPISPKTIGVGSNLTFTLAVTPVPVDGVFFGHGGAAPANSFPTNASLDSISGDFSWTPSISQTGATSITVWAFERSSVLNSNYTTFTVTVTNAVTPASGVVIDAILPQTVVEGTTLIFTNQAHATDNPTNTLVFSLLNAPAGAGLTNNSPTSGVFTWKPTAAQALNPTYTIREVVTEPSTSASNYQDFQVTVTRTNDCAQLDAFLAAVQQGGYFLLSDCSTIVLSNTLVISNNVTLDAGTNSVTIAGNGASRLFTVLPGVTNFTLRGLTLSGGQDAVGGGLYISQGAVVVLTNCTLVGNHAVGASGVAGADGASGGVHGGNGGSGTAGGAAYGGAICNLGTLSLLNCQFLTNSAAGGSGGAGGGGGNGSGSLSHGGNGGDGGSGAPGDGGAIYSAGSLWLSNCSFFGNSAAGGSGGVAGANGTASGTGSVAGMPGTGGAGAEGSGASLYSANYAVVLGCTFSGNAAQAGDSAAGGTDSAGNGISGSPGGNSLGGGICILNTAFLTNSTFYNNQVKGGGGGNGGDGRGLTRKGGNGGNGGYGLGGGLYNAGSAVVVNCTFFGCGAAGGTNGVAGSGNSPGANDGTAGLGLGGGIAQGSGAFLLRNTILVASTAGGNGYDSSASRITDGGYNISSDASLSLSGTSLKNTDPLISSTLTNNGGATLTLAILTNTSPAINKIPVSASPATDQRGIPRPQPLGGLSDIGAYELVTLPAILTQPQNQTPVQGSNATFNVYAVGDSLNYQWRFNLTNRIANATNASYTISSAAGTNAGNYDVVITNSYGSVTSTVASLAVLIPPAITTQPSNRTAVVGNSVSFSVTATGTAPLAYQWLFAGTNLAGATADTLSLTNAQLSQAGSYAVIVTNQVGSITSAVATLKVTFPPVITLQPTNQTVLVGSPTAFTVSAIGAAPLAYQWRFNGTNIAGATSTSYTVANAQVKNGGTYTVLITNVNGSLTSAPVTLTVYVLPHIAAQPNGSVQLAFAAALACRVEASTNLKSWQAVFTTNNLSTNTLMLQFTDTEAATLPKRFYRLAETFGGQPVLTNFIATNHSVSFSCVAAPVLACQIQASTNLSSWVNLLSTNLALPATFQFRYGEATNLPVRFYRLSQTPGS